jgi:M6 family metalloprotease-like protein
VEGQEAGDLQVVRDQIRSRTAGDTLKMTVLRKDKPLEVSVTLAATSRPLAATGPRAVMGIRTGSTEDGVRIEQVTPGSAAESGGLKVGDVILKLDGAAVAGAQRLNDVMGEKRPGDLVAVVFRRDGKEQEVKVKLGAEDSSPARPSWDTRLGVWKQEVYRLAVVAIEYPDVERNAKVAAQDWDRALFSRGTYTDKSATGQKVYGSMNDYYLEQSHGVFRVEGKCFEHVKVSKKRADYGSDTNRYALLTEALDKLRERDGKEVLTGFDGLCFIYAGSTVRTNRGNLYWPHRASVTYQGKRWPYFICSEGGTQMGSISVFAHEFGHLLGLPDLYARPENPGSEGVGVWCAMSNQNGNGRPQHFSAWCKEQLGWAKPALIDPTVKQKLILAPAEDSARECFKVLIRQDGSEYLLLENRMRKGFDRDLPAEGLLIWHIVDGKPLLAESHGITGPEGPRRFLGSVPYPSKSNNAFTPYTTPSSRSQKGGGLPVHITNIQRLPDGRITFYIGYEYL